MLKNKIFTQDVLLDVFQEIEALKQVNPINGKQMPGFVNNTLDQLKANLLARFEVNQ